MPTADNFFRCVYATGSGSSNATAFIVDKDGSTRQRIMRELDGMRRFAAPLFTVGFVAAPILAIVYIALLGVCG